MTIFWLQMFKLAVQNGITAVLFIKILVFKQNEKFMITAQEVFLYMLATIELHRVKTGKDRGELDLQEYIHVVDIFL